MCSRLALQLRHSCYFIYSKSAMVDSMVPTDDLFEGYERLCCIFLNESLATSPDLAVYKLPVSVPLGNFWNV